MTTTDRILKALADRTLYPPEERNSRLRADILSEEFRNRYASEKMIDEIDEIFIQRHIREANLEASRSPGLVDRARDHGQAWRDGTNKILGGFVDVLNKISPGEYDVKVNMLDGICQICQKPFDECNDEVSSRG